MVTSLNSRRMRTVPMRNRINVLGTDYKIEIHKFSEDDYLKRNDWEGYCDEDLKLIVIADFDEKECFQYFSEEQKDISAKGTLRHEIIHAFLNESGLSNSALRYDAAWAKNEEMVDWLAIQFPKIAKAYEYLGIM